MIELPIDMLEKTRLWDWGEPLAEGTCSLCHRDRPLYNNSKTICGACFTPKRCYDDKVVRLQAQMVFVNEDRAIVWSNPNASVVFAPTVEVIHPAEDRSYVQDAFAFIADEANRQKPFLFICFHHKRTMDPSDIVLNVDPDLLFVSANLPRPDNAHQAFKRIVDMNRVKALSNIDFGKMGPVDRRRLREQGYTDEDFSSAEWKAAQTIATGDPKKWF